MHVLVRQIDAVDAQSICALSEQLGYHLAASETETQIKAVLLRDDNCAFVAVSDENIIGWIHGLKAIRIETPPFVEIGGLVVDERYRGKGIGEKLVNRVKQWCIEQGISSLKVRCNTKRLEAHKFYNKIGFIEIKTQKVFEMEL